MFVLCVFPYIFYFDKTPIANFTILTILSGCSYRRETITSVPFPELFTLYLSTKPHLHPVKQLITFLLWPLVLTILMSVPINLSYKWNNIIIAWCGQGKPFNRMSSVFIHLQHRRISFLFRDEEYLQGGFESTLLIQSSVDGHLACSHLFAAMNSTTVNTDAHTHVSLRSCF